jgi:hypothetical protein
VFSRTSAGRSRPFLAGVDLVVLDLAAVDGLQVHGEAEDEVDPLGLAQVGEPVPGEQALDADDEPTAERRDGGEEGLGLAGELPVVDDLAVPVEESRTQTCMVLACRSMPQ